MRKVPNDQIRDNLRNKSYNDCYTNHKSRIHESLLMYMNNSIHKLIKKKKGKIIYYSSITPINTKGMMEIKYHYGKYSHRYYMQNSSNDDKNSGKI